MKVIITKQGQPVWKVICPACGLEAAVIDCSQDCEIMCPNCGSRMDQAKTEEDAKQEAPAPKRKGGRPKGSGKKKADMHPADPIGHCISCRHSVPKLDSKDKYGCAVDLKDHDADDTCLSWQKWQSSKSKEAKNE